MLLLIFLSMLVVLVGGCKSKKELKREEEIRARAEQVALKHFKDNYNVDVVFTENNLRPAYINTTISFQGHIEGMEDEKIYILIDYTTYEVSVASVPENTE